jgi:Big-like domain-containing protein
MKRFLLILFLGLAWTCPAPAAELKILEPADKSVLRGTVRFRILPQHGPMDEFLIPPDIIICSQYGLEIQTLHTDLDQQTGICSASVDTTKLKDGRYLFTIKYRTLIGPKAETATENLTLGVRNGSVRPARFTVESPQKATALSIEEPGDLVVRVVDARGRKLSGAGVKFQVDRGELDREGDITDDSGEALASVSVEEPGDVTVTITVENLPPVTRVIRFTK